MPLTHTPETLLSLDPEEEGLCLSCGTIQPHLDREARLGLCEECEEYAVLDAATLSRALALLDLDPPEDEKFSTLP